MTNRQETVKDHQERINRAMQYINEHIDEPLSLQVLADVACFSPYHFHRIFAAYVGEPLNTFIRRIRLEKAAQYLCHTKQSIIDIALAAGYESHAAFTKAFTKHFGESPTDFRKQRTVYLLQQQTLIITMKRKEDIMSPDIRNREETKVVYVQRTGPYKKAAEEAWGALCAFAGPKGMLNGQSEFIGIGHDDPSVTPEDKLRYDACVKITQDIAPEGDVGVQTVAGGKYAVFMHKGPYDNLMQTYQEAYGQWLPSSGEKLREEPCFEVYINDCQTTPPEELLTEIWVPIQ